MKAELLASIEEDEQSLLELQEEENEITEADEEEADPADDSASDESGQEDGEAKGDEGKQDEKLLEPKEESRPQTPAEWAAKRRAERDAKQRTVQHPVVQETAKAQPANDDPEPNRADDPEAWLMWDNRRIKAELEELKQGVGVIQAEKHETRVFQRAQQELEGYENKFRSVRSDYDQVTSHAYAQWTHALKIAAPHASKEDIAKHIMKEVFTIAGTAKLQGEDPAEAIYLHAVERFGVPEVKAEPKEDPKPKLPNLKEIDKNKKKSASPLMGGQSSSGLNLSKEAAADMSLAEFSKLTPTQLRELEAMG